MQEECTHPVSIEGDSIFIDNLEISDETTVQFFKELEEDQRKEAAKSAFRLGVGVLKISGATSEVDYVDRRFSDLEEKIKDMFDEENKKSAISKIDDIIAEYFDEESGSIHKLLDPHGEDTPAAKLLSSLRKELEIIKKELNIEEEKQKGTQKGFDFEKDELGPAISKIARIFGDDVEHTGEKTGALGDVGDYVVTINQEDSLGADLKLVFEAKDEKNKSRSDILDELRECKENRDADVGVMVFSEEASKTLRKEIQHYQRYSKEDCFVCSLDESRIPLEVTYKRARYLAIKEVLEEEREIDIEELEGLANSLERKLDNFSKLKTRITKDRKKIEKSLRKSYDGIGEKVKELEEDLQKDIKKFGDAMKVPSE